MYGRELLKLMAFMAGVLATLGSWRLEGAPAPPPEEYVFVKDTERWVGLMNESGLLVGKLDANGDFAHTYRLKGPYSMIPSFTVINLPGPKAKIVYEFRSSR